MQYLDLCFLRRYAVAPFGGPPSGFIRTTANCRSGDTARELPHTEGGQWATTLCALCSICRVVFCIFLGHCNAFVSTPQEDDVSGSLEFEKSKEPKHFPHLGHIVQCKLSSNGWISLSSELLTVRSFSSLTRSGEQGPSFWSRARFLPGL